MKALDELIELLKAAPPPQRATDGRFGAKAGEHKKKAPASKAKAKQQTPEQKAAAQAAEQKANRDKAAEASGLDLETLNSFAGGGALDGDGQAALSAAGLIETGGDGQPRMTPEGRALLAAANKGDVGAVRDTLSHTKDKVAAGQEKAKKDQEKADAKAKKEQEKAEKEKAGGGGGGGGGGSKPDPAAEKKANREKAIAALKDGPSSLNEASNTALLALADGGQVDQDMLAALADESGLAHRSANGDYVLSPAGKAYIQALDKGDAAGARAAIAAGSDLAAKANDQAAKAKTKADALAAKAKATAENTTKFDFYIELTKADHEQRIVEGIASTESIDNQPGVWEGCRYVGDVIDASAIESALPDYLKWGNVREMHQPSAVGTALKAEVVDGRLHLAVKVVDDTAWNKVKGGVYKGFSIGGQALKIVLEKLADGTYIRRILKLRLSEISLVDRPANPDAKILVFKGDSVMADPTSDAPDGSLADDVMSRLRTLSGASEPLAKASADPAKIVGLIQQARNTLELDGDMDGAALYTQAISLIQQAAGAASAPEAEEATEEVVDEPAEDDAAIAAGEDSSIALAAGRRSNLQKAGKAISGGRMEAMHGVVKSLLQLMATAGDETAQKAIGAYSLQKDEQPEGATAAAIKALVDTKDAIDTLAKVVFDQHNRLESLERQPAPGGPQLRAVTKSITGQAPAVQAPAAPAAPAPIVKAQLDRLQQLAHTDPNPSLRQEYQRQYDEIKKSLA